MVVETKSVGHAHEMFDFLRQKYTNIIMVGVGGAFGFLDDVLEQDEDCKTRDSGNFSSGNASAQEDNDDDIDAATEMKYLRVIQNQAKRKSRQFSITRIAF